MEAEVYEPDARRENLLQVAPTLLSSRNSGDLRRSEHSIMSVVRARGRRESPTTYAATGKRHSGFTRSVSGRPELNAGSPSSAYIFADYERSGSREPGSRAPRRVDAINDQQDYAHSAPKEPVACEDLQKLIRGL